MARLARIIVPGIAHHVTQRGNRREPIFFEPGDQEVYRDLLAEQTRKARVAVWAHCLMPNHVHLIAAVRYVSLNPVRARLAARAEDWGWLSAPAHLAGRDDTLVSVKPMHDRLGPAGLAALLRPSAEDEAAFAALRGARAAARPRGNGGFIAGLERLLDRPLRAAHRGARRRRWTERSRICYSAAYPLGWGIGIMSPYSFWEGRCFGCP